MLKKPSTWRRQDPQRWTTTTLSQPCRMEKRPTLKDRLNESSQSEDEELVRTADPEKAQQRANRAFRRASLRLIFMANLSLMRRVERHWEAKALGSDSPQQERDQATPKSSTAKRRDDLTGVGEPILLTPRTYPICRSVCTHEDSAGQTYLQAQGGQWRCQLTKKNVPMYLWVCRACGARWQRVPVEDPQKDAPKRAGSALQPVPTKSSGMKTGEKREMKAMEVEIHSGDENPIDALMKADLEDAQPHQG